MARRTWSTRWLVAAVEAALPAWWPCWRARVHGAADVRKCHSYRLDAFRRAMPGRSAGIEQGQVNAGVTGLRGRRLGLGASCAIRPTAGPGWRSSPAMRGASGRAVDALVDAACAGPGGGRHRQRHRAPVAGSGARPRAGARRWRFQVINCVRVVTRCAAGQVGGGGARTIAGPCWRGWGRRRPGVELLLDLMQARPAAAADLHVEAHAVGTASGHQREQRRGTGPWLRLALRSCSCANFAGTGPVSSLLSSRFMPEATRYQASPIPMPGRCPIGTRLGEFEIRRVLGVGGFGIVYLAFDHLLEREVALKEYMPSTLVDRAETMHVSLISQANADTFALGLRSFVNEARLLARFDHPSLVKVHRFWEANGTAYMAMPLYKGRTVRDVRLEMQTRPTKPGCAASWSRCWARSRSCTPRTSTTATSRPTTS
jgi:hypothetical protein